MTRWLPVQLAIYVVVPVLTLGGYALVIAACTEHYR